MVAVKELLGHKSIEMTLRYAHLSVENKRIALEILSSRFPTVVTNSVTEGSFKSGDEDKFREAFENKGFSGCPRSSDG